MSAEIRKWSEALTMLVEYLGSAAFTIPSSSGERCIEEAEAVPLVVVSLIVREVVRTPGQLHVVAPRAFVDPASVKTLEGESHV